MLEIRAAKDIIKRHPTHFIGGTSALNLVFKTILRFTWWKILGLSSWVIGRDDVSDKMGGGITNEKVLAFDGVNL